MRGFVVMVRLGDGDTVESDFDEIRKALVSRQERHNAPCRALEIEYYAPRDQTLRIKEFWLKKSQDDEFLLNFFAATSDVGLCILTPDGSNIVRIGFEYGPTR